ncbi:MAG TPA: HAMP domain-containing histidine kinase [Candidatus Scybalocola faecavium]|nr:HAMP domain-containing histidine kinase [Candidatus Scybalocola faecavium]
MKRWIKNGTKVFIPVVFVGFTLMLVWMIWSFVPRTGARFGMLAVCGGIYLAAGLGIWLQRRQIYRFADELCDVLDDLMSGKEPEISRAYEDSLTGKVSEKLIRFYDVMSEDRKDSRHDKAVIQELVSDISHQVKTPVANLKLYADILKNPGFPEEKRGEFMHTMDVQINKLDFLMQSLIKMSRLETGTFTLHVDENPVSETIARAMSTVWAKAEKKGITLSASCDSGILARHDPKWTAEALGNILDNGVKYTPEGGSVTVTVRPWQFYTRIDIADTGIGIGEEHYNDIFKRFYRTAQVAGEEGVGLGLYLAGSIIALEKGYISVASCLGQGTTFSVYLLNS